MTADKESAYAYRPNRPRLLDKKIAVTEAHTENVDVLVVNCPPEPFADPAYACAAKRRGQDALWRN